MKTKSFLIAALMIGTSASFAQQVEIDDMYFTSKDRAALNAAKPLPTIKSNEEFDVVRPKMTEINPTDSYSGRGTNPEYTAKTAINSAPTKANPNYFPTAYQANAINQNLAYQPTGMNNLYNYNGFNNYGYNYGMNSFYGNGYNPFCSPYSYRYGMGGITPFYGMGSMFGWGGFNSFSMGYGYPYSSFYGNYGYGYSPFNYGYGSNFYPNIIVINSNSDTNNDFVRGKRGTRAGSDTYYDVNRTRGTVSANNSGNSGGRVSSNQYYDRSWRSSMPQPDQSSRRSYYNNSGNPRSAWEGGDGQSSFGNSRSSFNNGNSNGNFGGGSRTSGFSGGGGGSSSSGSSSGGGGGGGRGRH